MHSQRNEDEIVRALVGETGTLLDIGANDGRTLSNSYLFTSSGWNGVLVEPSARSFARLRALYEGRGDIQLLQYAVSDFCGRAEFYESGECLRQGDSALLSTLRPEQAAQWNPGIFEKSQVEVIDVPTLLSLCRYKRFDFVTIDTEGSDFAIVRQLDLGAIGCKALCVEYCHDLGEKRALIDHVRAQGFTLHADTRVNLVFRATRAT